MWIIVGTRVVDHDWSEGQFQCAECESTQVYTHHKVCRFFHVFFIPMIRLETLDEYIECARCSSTFKTSAVPHELPAARAKLTRSSSLRGRRLPAGAATGDEKYAAKLDDELDRFDA